MKLHRSSEIRNKLIPYIVFPAIIGILTGILIFLFKIAASEVMSCSAWIYGLVREHPIYLPLLILGGIAIGVIAATILRYAGECRGGGIPTAVASIRGLLPLKWIQGIFVLFGSALLTYFAGIPLGNEGPSVQMGAAVGEGGSCLSKKNKHAWERYLMTGGACSGFAIATGAPLSGILFALEEAHRRFSTVLVTVASISVVFGVITQRYLCFFFGVDPTFLHLSIPEILPMRYLWTVILIGAACGLCSLLFTGLYRVIGTFFKRRTGKLPFAARLAIIFGATALLGFCSANFIGTGHSLIEDVLHGKTVWYAVLLAFAVRAIVMICANNEGVSGGIFVPNLAFGAMIASLLADGLIALHIVEEEYYVILIVVGMASFLAASSRTPITAIAFAAEALCIASNIFPVVVGVVVAFLIVEASGKLSFADAVIEAHVESAHRGRVAVIVDSHMTVQAGSFADGMETRDILWPPTCAVLSIDRNRSHALHHSAQEIREGDVVHLHYQTYDPDQTMQMLTAILGEQQDGQRIRAHLGSNEHLVPLD